MSNEETSVGGEDTLSVSLNQIVDYAISQEDKPFADKIELMFYRLYGPLLTPEDILKLHELQEHFKVKNLPPVTKNYTINKGDNVAKKIIISKVGTFNQNVEEQNNTFPTPQIGVQQKKIGNE